MNESFICLKYALSFKIESSNFMSESLNQSLNWIESQKYVHSETQLVFVWNSYYVGDTEIN